MEGFNDDLILCIRKIILSTVEKGFNREKAQERKTSYKDNESFSIKTKGQDKTNHIEVRDTGTGSRSSRGQIGRT